ncbi:MAG: histidine phosphotransferase [Rhodobacteraceae bacterium]|nr:histidine phosphotransferase [Paracoccaceae bacterium]
MYAKDIDIASLISSRICHDLVSPLGAISNGLELLELTGITRTPEIVLLNDSVDSATARVQFFRIAYGTTSSEAMLNADMLQKTLHGYYADTRITAHWLENGPVPREQGKLLLLLAQCLETALSYGGEIDIRQCEEGWMLEGSGRINLTHPVWQVLNGGDSQEPLQSSVVQFELARALAEQQNLKIEIASTEDVMRIKVS